MTIRPQNLGNGNNTEVKHGNARALTVARRLPAHQALIAQNKPPASGSRVVAAIDMGNPDSWSTPDTAADLVVGSHWAPETYRTAYRSEGHALTPGSALVLRVLAVPSGDQQDSAAAGGGSAESDGPGGSVYAAVVFENTEADTTSAAVEIALPASSETDAAQPQGDGAAIDEMFSEELLVVPDGFLEDPDENNKFSRDGVTMSLNISLRGGCRVIEAHIDEVPIALAHDDTDDLPASAVYTDGAGEPLPSYPAPYPVERLSGAVNGDRRGGTEAMVSVAERFHELLGPMLFWWTPYAEHVDAVNDVQSTGAGTGDNEWPGVSHTGTTPALLWDTSITTLWDADTPSATLAAGGHGRRAQQSAYEALEGRVGAQRVAVGVYAKMGGASETGFVRVGTGEWSYVDVPVAGDAYAWVLVQAHLEVGRGPLDAANLWVYLAGDVSTDTIDVRGMFIADLPDPSRGVV